MTDKDKIIRRQTVIPLILIMLPLMAVFILTLSSGISSKYSFWPGYHILITDYKDNSEISALLENDDNFYEIVSRYNTDIEYSNFNELEKISISSLNDRFNPADPRFDSFMKSADSYFKTESESIEKEIIYLKTDLSENKTAAVLENIIPEEYSWEIASLSFSRLSFIAPAVFLLITALLIFLKKMKSIFFFFISVLWVTVILKTDISFFYTAVLNIVFISYIIEIIEFIVRSWFDSGKLNINIILNRKNLIIAVSVFIFSNAVIFLINPDIKSFLLFNTVFIIECSVLFLDLVYSLKKAGSYIHRIFSSVPILETNKNRIFDKWIYLKPVYFYLIVLVFTVPAVFFSAGKSSFPLPAPSSVIKSSSNLFTDLKQLNDYAPESADLQYLPDISDYFKHLAYQIRLPYKSDYSLPGNNEKISISHYILNKNNFQEEKKTAYLFTESWLKDNIIRVKENGLTGLMMSAGTTVKVVLTDKSSVINPFSFGCLYCVFYIVLIFMVVWKEKTGKTNYEKHILPVIKRRKQQAA